METELSAATILVVDDTPANLKLLGEMLESHGYHVMTLPNGPMALNAVVKTTPDLILLDIKMPGMSGFEVCERLKGDAATRDIPVIFISALTETVDKVNAFSAGGVDYVTKPFQFEEVLARVQTHLHLRALQRQLANHNENLEKQVALRTAELEQANQQLKELGEIKSQFLAMISYEIRTPASGVLGIGQLILDMCPEGEKAVLYSQLFHQSSSRLCNIIDDAALIANLDNLMNYGDVSTPLFTLVEKLPSVDSDIVAVIHPDSNLKVVDIKGEQGLLLKALGIVLRLATVFSCEKNRVQLMMDVDDEFLHILIALDVLKVSPECAEQFFRVESLVRASTSAESLGLAPVVAHKIITLLGGCMYLCPDMSLAGHIEIALPLAK